MCMAYVHVSIHVHVCVGYTCNCVYVGPRLILGIFCNLHYPWSRVSQSNPEFTNTTRFTSQLAGITCLCLPSWNGRLVDTFTWHLHGSRGFELSSFCLCCRHFNHWVKPSDPKGIFIIVCSAKNRRWHMCDITCTHTETYMLCLHTCAICTVIPIHLSTSPNTHRKCLFQLRIIETLSKLDSLRGTWGSALTPQVPAERLTTLGKSHWVRAVPTLAPAHGIIRIRIYID